MRRNEGLTQATQSKTIESTRTQHYETPCVDHQPNSFEHSKPARPMSPSSTFRPGEVSGVSGGGEASGSPGLSPPENRPYDHFWREQNAPVSFELVYLLQVTTSRHHRRRERFVPLVESYYTCRRRHSKELWIHVFICSENPEEVVQRIAHPSGGVENDGCRSCPQTQSLVKKTGFSLVLHYYHLSMSNTDGCLLSDDGRSPSNSKSASQNSPHQKPPSRNATMWRLLS